MAGDLGLLARLLAYQGGRAFPRASHRLVSVQPSALVLCPLAMAGEDTTIHAVAYGALGRPPRVLCVPDPRRRDDQFRLLEVLGADVESDFGHCRDAGRFPQLWVSSAPAAAHLDTLADRLRYSRLNPRVRRFGELLSYAAGRYPVAGQQALVTATGALKLHWASGQQESEDEHLGALLTWIDPPAGQDVFDAVAAAEAAPMGVKTDPLFDEEVLAPLVAGYNAAAREGASATVLRRHAASIKAALEPVVRPIYDATQRAVALLAGSRLPPLPDLPAMEAREAAEFESFMRARDAGIPLALRDSPKAAAFGLAGREQAAESVEAALLVGDRVARARGRLSGRVLLGEVESPRCARSGPRAVVHRFDVRSHQRVLHLRRRDELCWVEDPRLRVVVEDVRRDTAVTRVSVRIVAGQRAVGPPAAGATLELVKGVPRWDDVWRLRGHLKTALATTPWTHAAGGVPPATPTRRPAPTDPLTAVEGLR